MKRLIRLTRYATVGVLCALLHNVVIIGGDLLGIHYIFACFISFAVTLVLAYSLHSAWTFAAVRSADSFLRYGAAMAINIPLSIAGLYLAHDLIGLPIPLAAPAATAAQFALNYFVTAWTVAGQRPMQRISR